MTGGEVRVSTEVSWPWWARPFIAAKILFGAKIKVHSIVRTAQDPGEVKDKDSRIELVAWFSRRR